MKAIMFAALNMEYAHTGNLLRGRYITEFINVIDKLG
jgi:hypothetical protein